MTLMRPDVVNSTSAILYNDSAMEVDIMSDILWDFYNRFSGETNYLLIILYLPIMALAVTANVLVITVVFKYHYMRRYVRNSVGGMNRSNRNMKADCCLGFFRNDSLKFQ